MQSAEGRLAVGRGPDRCWVEALIGVRVGRPVLGRRGAQGVECLASWGRRPSLKPTDVPSTGVRCWLAG
ncbi:hypothetical protein GOP47_0014383 [Adiantum capillus-veneris]|uniref:Uncharacterized protein n=1 Tax=Adiantum capillus-veneris TaxID=13818 RepID=A0A9D4ULJ2_ADICA|nr:hypothetical protein GOP47_0014383 [Adiantum capillus-veneris]